MLGSFGFYWKIFKYKLYIPIKTVLETLACRCEYYNMFSIIVSCYHWQRWRILHQLRNKGIYLKSVFFIIQSNNYFFIIQSNFFTTYKVSSVSYFDIIISLNVLNLHLSSTHFLWLPFCNILFNVSFFCSKFMKTLVKEQCILFLSIKVE